MDNGITMGKIIALILSLSKSIAIKYESVGIASIEEGPQSNQITFVLVNGDRHTVSFSLSASGISFTPPTGMISTNVQNAIVEIFNKVGDQFITITAESGATQGVITQEQYEKLNSSANVYILFNNEIFRKQGGGTNEIFYSTIDGEFITKNITINTTTLEWSLTASSGGGGGTKVIWRTW